MAPRKIDPREQFSKKLAGRAEWFWFGYMICLVVAMVIQPEAAMQMVYLGMMVTGVMVVSVLAYTKNSIDEKWFFWANEIAKSMHGNQGKEEPGKEEGEGSNG